MVNGKSASQAACRVVVLLITLLAVGVAPRPAAAVDLNAIWPDLGLPGFKVTPFITERVEYQSNVFQAPSGAQDDFVSKTIPGVIVELPLGRHRLELGTRVEVLRWLDLNKQDTEHYFFLGKLLLEFPGGLKMGVKDDFARTTDPPGTELTGRIESTTNVLSPSLEYGFAQRYAIGFDYVWTHVDFEPLVNSLDRDEHTFGVTGFYKVQPKTDLLLNVAYGFKEFDSAPTRDVTRYLGVIGVRGDLTSRLTSTFRLGWENRRPDNSRLTEYNGPVAGGDFVFQPTERTRLLLVTDRSVQESVFQTNLWYLQNLVTISAEHFLTRKLLVSGRIFGGTNEYPDKAQRVSGLYGWRYDTIVGVGLAADYQIQRWLAVGADVTHTRRDSNFDVFDFKNDVIGAKVTLSF
jgi:hypothetical protein